MHETYHRARAQREQELAASASDSAVRGDHFRLAALHIAKADRERLLEERNQLGVTITDSKKAAAG